MFSGTIPRKNSNTLEKLVPVRMDPMTSSLYKNTPSTVNISVMTELMTRNLVIRRFPLLFIRAALPTPQMAVSTVKKMTGPAVASRSLMNTSCTGVKKTLVISFMVSSDRAAFPANPAKRPMKMESSSPTPGLTWRLFSLSVRVLMPF